MYVPMDDLSVPNIFTADLEGPAMPELAENELLKQIQTTERELKKTEMPYRFNNLFDLRFPDALLPLPESDVYEHYAIYSWMEDSRLIYDILLDICIDHEVDAVLDIGCASGVQSWIFRNNGISFHGIDAVQEGYKFPYYPSERAGTTSYVSCSFPSEDWDRITESMLSGYKNPCIISSLCALWIVHAPIEEQINAILRHAKLAILYVPSDVVKDLELPEGVKKTVIDGGRTGGCFLVLESGVRG